ncbi:filamentous hemagglutinin N-terminal domain-containing protein [Caballeronia sp. GAWG1-5s-s]|uniref:two-partner secretion domain-containing protein n=1 Tax=Caballeronia sp. GAWG1-5s-s TaxID=2921743 RepID=UPI002028BE16|nr:filamentous hemagglutinin N-terminal domain-containing protein [Caballeronia sp. GAWG1-5s-s]
MRDLPFVHVKRCTLVVLIAFAIAGHAAGPLPQNGRFVAGSGVITQSAGAVNITQNTTRGVIDWRSFSIGPGNRVDVNNGSGTTLSRVTGTSASRLDGALSATGSFYLINPQGVVIGPSGVVTTGGRFVASTLDVDDGAFMAGNGKLQFTGTSDAVVVNLGAIGSSGGDVILISRAMTLNAGTIDAPKGTAELVTGNAVLLQDATATKQVFVQAGAQGDVVNAGSVRAAQIQLNAADGNVFALAAHHGGIRATGTTVRDGHVWLVASNGDVQQTGGVAARDADGSGGTLDTNGHTVHLDGARVRAAQWNVDTDTFDASPGNIIALARSLSGGTSVTLSTSGDIGMNTTLRWHGDASLTLAAGHSVLLGPNATISNRGAGNLTLRADGKGIDNGGGVVNAGTIDWSKSNGSVAAMYDGNGAHQPGTVRTNAAWKAPEFSGLKMQVTGYRLVNTPSELKNISGDLVANYALGRDIQVSGTYVPIAINNTKGFTGQFDGLGHAIKGLNFSGSYYDFNDLQGLFATIGASGVVRNLSIKDATGDSGASLLGVVAGQSAGLVTNVRTTGTMFSQVIGAGAIAGVVGKNTGTVYRATSDVSMSAQGSMAGIALLNDGLVAQSFANNDSGGGSHSHGGGVVGYNSATGIIRQSYATGSVGGVTAGGIVLSNEGRIEQSFSATYLPDMLPGYVGGIALRNSGSIGNDVYWDKQVSGVTVGVADGTAVPTASGLTTAQMTTASSFAPSYNFGPGGAWTLLPGVGHPVLRWAVETRQ